MLTDNNPIGRVATDCRCYAQHPPLLTAKLELLLSVQPFLFLIRLYSCCRSIFACTYNFGDFE